MEKVRVVPMLQKHRLDKSGKSQIIIRVYFNSDVVANESLGKKIELLFWDQDKRLVKPSAPNAHLLNALIKSKTNELEKKFLETELRGVKLTKHRVKNISTGKDPGHDYFMFCRQVIPIKYPKAEQFETRRQHLAELTKLECFRKEVSFGDIDFKFLSEYKAWMITERKNVDNTIWKTFKAMNTMLNEAIRHGGYLKVNPFDEFNRGRYVQGRRTYLEISDCDKIHKLLQEDIPDRLRLVGCYYLFMCYTGFRFQDATKFFNYDTHVINDERIIIDTQKTNTEVNLFIHSRLREVLEAIRNHPLEISNKEFNSYTKVLATMAKINIAITAHTGRHTFGATLAELDVPIEKAQKLLGHKDKKSTEIYYHIKNKSLDSEMRKWDSLVATV